MLVNSKSGKSKLGPVEKETLEENYKKFIIAVLDQQEKGNSQQLLSKYDEDLKEIFEKADPS